MTPDERDRLVRVEEGYRKISETLSEVKAKVDDMHNRMTLGRGAFMAIVKIGAIVLGFLGIAKALGVNFWDWRV